MSESDYGYEVECPKCEYETIVTAKPLDVEDPPECPECEEQETAQGLGDLFGPGIPLLELKEGDDG